MRRGALSDSRGLIWTHSNELEKLNLSDIDRTVLRFTESNWDIQWKCSTMHKQLLNLLKLIRFTRNHPNSLELSRTH